MKINLEEHRPITAYRDCIFETILVEEGVPLFFELHLQRMLRGSVEILGLTMSLEEIRKGVSSFIGKGNYGFRIILNKEGNLILSKRDLEGCFSHKLAVSDSPRCSIEKKFRYKTWDYGTRLEALQRCREEGYQDILYLNENGYVAGNAVSNIFFLKEGVLYTPGLNNGLLDGIVRQVLVEQLNAQEGDFELREILSSEGVWITNSLLGMISIQEVAGEPINSDTKEMDRISDAYERLKELDKRSYHG